MNILVVDDEKEIADLVELYMINEGYNVYKCYDGKTALQYIDEVEMDLAILDVMLPDMNGFDICKKIREKYNYLVIMLTAKDENEDKVLGLTIGADDYITKPFNPSELVARVKAHFRRCSKYNVTKNENVYDNAGLVINRDTHKCSVYDKEIFLTPIEFDILWLLCENAGNVISSEEIFEKVWKEKYYESNNTVMVHIRRIREKMAYVSKNPNFIKTVWGVGYKIEK